ncbi:endolysin [Cytophagales bacterium WSM2-2]|nr:endolysin [Cytophagales bacterium WSM2-2]
MSRQSIIDKAASQNGMKENPANSNKTIYGQWYGLDGVAWCAIFVSWVYDQAGHPLGKIDSPKGYHYCPSAYNFWKAHNMLTSSPQPGDIVLFDWDGDGSSDHTGIFLQWIDQGKTFKSWEGNTAIGNESDGGQVMLRQRNASVVKAFVNPGIFNDKIDDHPSEYKNGDNGAEVARIQKMLYDLNYEVVVDGKFGSGTEKAVKNFQQTKGITTTGIVDRITEGALEAEINKPKSTDAKTTTGSFLTKGDTGAAVLALQKALNRNGAKPALTEDGVYGGDTVVAVKAFQKKEGLQVDGVAGPATLKALGVKA